MRVVGGYEYLCDFVALASFVTGTATDGLHVAAGGDPLATTVYI